MAIRNAIHCYSTPFESTLRNKPFMDELQAAPTTRTEDEIDLFELVQGLWDQKWLIVGITGLATLAGLLAALLLPPTYQSSTQIRPPDLSNLTQVNETGILALTSEEAFDRALSEIRSQQARMRTFKELETKYSVQGGENEATSTQRNSVSATTNGETPDVDEWDWRSLSDRIQIAKEDDASFATISYSHKDSEFAARVVNTLINTSNQLAVSTLISELKSSLQIRYTYIEERIKQEIELETRSTHDRIIQLEEEVDVQRLQLTDRIKALRAKNEQLRLDRISALEEALALAESIPIVEPRILGKLGDANNGGLAIRVGFEEDFDSLYLRGTKILSAQIKALKARSSNDFTSPDIRDLQAELAQLEHNRDVEILQDRENAEAFVPNIREMRTESIHIHNLLAQDYSGLSLIKLDEFAAAPKDPIKPRKTLIVAASFLAGSTLGILAALISQTIFRRRGQLESRGQQ